MSDTLCTISLSEIDLSDDRYRIRLEQPDIETAAHAVHISGILIPPVVAKVLKDSDSTGTGNRYAVVSGLSLLLALTRTGRDKAQVLLTDPACSPRDILIRAVASASLENQLSQAELIRAAGLLNAVMDTKEMAKNSAVLFGRKMNAGYLEQLISLFQAGDRMIRLVQTGRLALKSAVRLLDFQGPERELFLTLFETVNFSSSRQGQVLIFLKEIAARDRIGLAEAFGRMNLDEIVSDPDMDGVLKTSLVFKTVYETRYPALSGHQEQVKSVIQSLKLGQGIRFSPPDNPDGLAYTISFSVKNLKEFETRSEKISSLIDHPALKELFRS